jgi:hypothetical protein
LARNAIGAHSEAGAFLMCGQCDELFIESAEVLDELVQVRSSVPTGDDTGSGMAVRTYQTILNCIHSQDSRDDWHVQEVCFALAIAVERLTALEQAGIPT